MAVTEQSRIAFLQFGDFREADQRVRDGLGETYHAQRFSMGVVERLAERTALTAVISVESNAPHDEILHSGVRSIGLQNIWSGEKGALVRCLEEISPTQLVLRYPSIEILRWAQPRAMPVLVTFADSFTYRLGLHGLVDRWRFHQLAALLNRPFVSFVGNHNLGASRSLASIGVEPRKIIPWDWPRSPTPADYPAKWQPKQSGKKLICVGQVNEAKGVGDVLRALASPQLRNMNVSLDVLGDGDIREMNALAAELRVSDRVHFAGKVPYEQVAPAMHNADAVIVYSQHGYAEGLPGSIYVGLASRTPIVLSDHPMFVSYFKSGVDAIIAPERNPPALASEIARLFEDRALYRSLSEGSDNVFTRIVHPVTWEDVVERGLRLNSEDRTWLTERALPAWL